MAKGAILPIHIDDPHQLLSTPKGALAADLHVQVVPAKGHHYEAIIVASSKNSRDHQITIPFGAPVSAQVVSPHLAVDVVGTQGKRLMPKLPRNTQRTTITHATLAALANNYRAMVKTGSVPRNRTLESGIGIKVE
jgi:hypothetical protein